MEKKVRVHYSLYDSDQSVVLPVKYEVLEDNGSTIYQCSVDLLEDELPDWLDIKDFAIETHYENGVNATYYSRIPGIKTVDTALFIPIVYRTIFVAENAKRY